MSIRNDLDADAGRPRPLRARRRACPTLEVPAGETREVRFTSGRAGTYHYWASTMGAPVPFRELAGAFVVDPAGGAVEPDRILVITEWTSLTPQQLGEIVTADDATEAFVELEPRFTFVINGLSWPATERLTYQLGQTVRWRVINLSSQAHPMHLHGFYFDVDSLGNGLRDQPFDDAQRRRVVTQLMPSGGTMTMTWTPEREGNWLFHCHIMHHVSPMRRLRAGAGDHTQHASGAHAGSHGDHADRAGHGRHGDRRHRARCAPRHAPARNRRDSGRAAQAHARDAARDRHAVTRRAAAGFVLSEGERRQPRRTTSLRQVRRSCSGATSRSRSRS